MHVILDISRLLFSARRATPSGIDRVEMAYAGHWCRAPAADSSFVAQAPWGGFGVVPRPLVQAAVESLATLWSGGAPGDADARRALAILGRVQAGLALGEGRLALRGVLRRHRRPVFLLASHQGLHAGQSIAALRRAGASFVPFLHDLIPLTHPEYSRAPQIRRHRLRLQSVVQQADGVVVNSAATAASLQPWLATAGGSPPPVAIAPLGIPPLPRGAAVAGAQPYFVNLGTLEPRKNHLLLLHLWRQLAAEGGAATPQLLLLGRRGWENENILDMLDRCEALRGLVIETGPLPDLEIRRLLSGARALLFPSFAEGYGLPLAEALGLGVPAICSDLPALREVGGAVPDYLDPLDGAGWRRAVLDYAAPDSAGRAAQLSRLRHWQAPRWEDHFAILEDFLASLVERRASPAGTATWPALRHPLALAHP